jgi:hypothetical protein
MSNKEFSLVEAMDEHLVKPRKLYRSRPGLYPSEASVSYILDGRKHTVGHCNRASYYRLQPDVQKTNPGGASLNIKGLIGKADELALVEAIKEMGLYVDSSVKFFQPEFVLSGELDFVVKNPLTGGEVLYECKSYYGVYANKLICGTKPKFYKTKDNVAGIPGAPKESQFLQAVLYSWEYKDAVEESRMLYIERGDGHRVEFRVGTTEDSDFCYWEQIPGPYWTYFEAGKKIQPYTIHDVHQRYKELAEYARKKELPPMDFEEVWSPEKVEWGFKNKVISQTKYNDFHKKKKSVGDWHCSYCAYKDKCKEDFLTYGR